MQIKKCSRCGETKALKEFSTNHLSRDGHDHRCKICVRAYNKEYYRNNREKLQLYGKIYYKENKEKIALHQRQHYKETREVQRTYRREYYRENAEEIKAKVKKYQEKNRKKVKMQKKKHYKENKLEVRERRLQNSYGLSLIDYGNILAAQNNCCAICGKTQEEEIEAVGWCLSVDHDHETDKVRGLLCGKCNMALGGFQDSPKLLRKAASYIKNSLEDKEKFYG